MFDIYEPFGVHISSPLDVDLLDEEVSVLEQEFLPLMDDTPLSDDILSLFEARNQVINSTPDLSEISKSIERRNYVSMYYQHSNGKKGHRLIEPFALGRGYKLPDGSITGDGNHYIRAFIIMNSERDKYLKGGKKGFKRKSVSVSDKDPRWRLFRVDRIQTWTNLQSKFSHYRNLYNPNDKQMGKIITSLQLNEFPRGMNPVIKK